MSRPKHDSRRLGARLSKFRVAAGLLQRQVAVLVRVSPSTVAMWESGRRTPTVYDLDAYLRVVGGSITLGVSQ
jgi:transcriptional regulator with XRE-family HTH domain